MISATTARVAPGGVLASVTSQPPLTLRQVRADGPGVCALCLVGTAAGPLAGDSLSLSLTVDDGAAATVQAAGASLAQGRSGGTGSLSTALTIGAGACLTGRPGAVVVSHGGRVDMHVDIVLHGDATLDWRELLVLGRTGGEPGQATLRWDVVRNGRPVLRQAVDLTDVSWPGLLSGGRVMASALLTGPSVEARTVVLDQTAVAARLDPHTVLITVLGTDAAEVSVRTETLCALFALSTVGTDA